MLNDITGLGHHYVCEHCGRHLKYPVPHKCNGNFRKKKLSFKEIASEKYKWNKQKGNVDVKTKFICECKAIRGIANTLINLIEESSSVDNTKNFDKFNYQIAKIREYSFVLDNRLKEFCSNNINE